ncbi:MAG: DUF1700 domain-containing protein [Ruminiclostridium sp.]|nr:DUF1700 domain-containing protein [Ruminiclostridium sp.]
MICNTKSEFLTGLRIALENNNVTDTTDILTDFRQHFEDGEAAGETEAEVCRKLGDIDEIIKQYISEDDAVISPANDFGAAQTTADSSGFGADTQYSAPPPQYGNVQTAAQPDSFRPSGGKIAGIICLDLFIYSWAIPTLASLIISLYGVTISFCASGLGVFIGGILSIFANMSGIIETGFMPVSLIFLGIMFMAFGGMLIIASIAATKGFINIIIAIINHHARIFSGHNVLKKLSKKNKEVQ